jgi:hypothetical protein
MGRMKAFYQDVLDANKGLPPGVTVKEYVEMNKLKILNYEEYKRYKSREIDFKSETPNKIQKEKW